MRGEHDGVAHTGREIVWKGAGLQEQGIDARTGDVLVEVDERYFRPTEVEFLLGDPSKAAKALGWKHTTTFRDLVTEMVKSDLQLVPAEMKQRGAQLP